VKLSSRPTNAEAADTKVNQQTRLFFFFFFQEKMKLFFSFYFKRHGKRF
jgi:hypothetical protein